MNDTTLSYDDIDAAKVRSDIADNAQSSFAFYLMNTLATVIACYGLFANSPAVVIGAMIVAMLLGPITGVALALVDNDKGLLRTALMTLAFGTLGVMLTAYIIGLIHHDLMLTDEIMARTAPNLMDLMVALAGGAAGAYASISKRLSGAFIGVAIATALVPPLSVSGIMLARGNYQLALNAFSLAFANMVAIQLASSTVIWFSGLRKSTSPADHKIQFFLKRNFVSLVIFGLLALILADNFRGLLSSQIYQNKVEQVLNDKLAQFPGSFLVETRFGSLATEDNSLLKAFAFHNTGEKLPVIIRAVVRGPRILSGDEVAALENAMPKPLDNRQIELRVRFVETKVIGRNGQMFVE